MGTLADINRQKSLLALAKFGNDIEQLKAAVLQVQQVVFGWPPDAPQGGLAQAVALAVDRQGFLLSGLRHVAATLGINEAALAAVYQADVERAKAEPAGERYSIQETSVTEMAAEEDARVDLERLRELAYGEAEQPQVAEDPSPEA